jgi:hypothetical protein
MDVGFIILCPDKNIAGLKNSLNSILYNSYGRESIAIVGNNVNANDLKAFKEICPTHKGKDTITSLINLGMKKINHEWALLMFGGNRIRPYLERKIERFITSEKDVIFPVTITEQKYDFVSSSLNGVVINTKFFKEVGDFPEAPMIKEGMNDFEMAKLFWSVDAIENKAIFKGIVGIRIT